MFLKKESGKKSSVTVNARYKNQLKKSICCCENQHLSEKFTDAGNS